MAKNSSLALSLLPRCSRESALANSQSARALSGGTGGRFLTLFAAPLCALWLVAGRNHCAAIDPGSYST